MVAATVPLDELGIADVLAEKEEVGVDPLDVAETPRRRHRGLRSGRHPARDLLVEAHLLDPLVDPVDLLFRELPVEGGEELALHRVQMAAQKSDHAGDVAPAPGVVVDATPEAGVVVQHPGHLALQLVAAVGQPAQQPRVDPGQPRGLGIEGGALGPQVGYHDVLQVVGHPGEGGQLLGLVAPLVHQLLELRDQGNPAPEPVVEVAEAVGRRHPSHHGSHTGEAPGAKLPGSAGTAAVPGRRATSRPRSRLTIS